MNNTSANATTSLVSAVTPAWEMLLIGILITAATVANLLVIIAFLRESRVRTAFNYYLFNQAIADCLLSTTDMTSYAIYTCYSYWPMGYTACTFWLYCDNLGFAIILQSIAVASLDRLWAVTFPLSYRQHHTRRKAWLAIAVIWIFSHVMLVPSLAYYRLYVGIFEDPGQCYWDPLLQPQFASPFYINAVLFWAPAILTVLVYSITTLQLIRRRKLFRRSVHGAVAATSDVRRLKKERQVYTLLSLLLGGYLIFYTPYYVYEALSMSSGYYSFSFNTTTYWLGFCESAINPVLFYLGSPEMKEAVHRLVRCDGRRSPKNIIGPSRSLQRSAGQLVGRTISS